MTLGYWIVVAPIITVLIVMLLRKIIRSPQFSHEVGYYVAIIAVLALLADLVTITWAVFYL